MDPEERSRRPSKVALAHLPTPLNPLPRLSEVLGANLWIKRDDATGGPEAGNKIRKLEYLVADAQAKGADTLITCGGVQSNHARATAVVAARLGMKAVLLLRLPSLTDDRDGSGVPPTEPRAPLAGNLALGELVGADVRLITATSYRRRAVVMAAAAERVRESGGVPYVIVEGGSDGLGSIGYVDAMAEIEAQLAQAKESAFDAIVVACGSGGTAAGIALGARHHRVSRRVIAVAVCNDQAYFDERIRAIIDEARAHLPADWGQEAAWEVRDAFKGPAYGVSTEPQQKSMVAAARTEGLVLDPVYSGKAFHALAELCKEELRGQKVLFVHTGGMPGLLAQSAIFSSHLRKSGRAH